MALLCKELGVLPTTGGLLEQSPVMVELLSEAMVASAERQELETKKARDKASPSGV